MYWILAALLAAGDPKVTVSPRLGLWSPGRPVHVTVRVAVPEPTREMYCPSVEILWPSGTKSRNEPDCEPWDSLDDQDRVPIPFSRTMPFGPGEHTITVWVWQGTKKRKYEFAVSIGGG